MREASNEELREALEARERQYNAALLYLQGIRDRMLTVDQKSVRYYASLFDTKEETK